MFRSILARTLVSGVAAVVLFPTAAFAAHGGGSGGTTSSGSGSCTVSPNPVPLNTSYSVNGSGLPANSMVDVFATDSTGGTSSTTAMTDGTGHVSVLEHAWAAGPGSAQVTDTSRKHNLLASCTFSITS